MSEHESFEPELTAFERSLAGLVPQASRVDRDQLMIELGRSQEQRRRRFGLAGPAWALSTAALVLVCAVLSWKLSNVTVKYETLLAATRQDPTVPAAAGTPETARALADAQQDETESSTPWRGFRHRLSSREIVGLTSPGSQDFPSAAEESSPSRGERPALRARDRSAWSEWLEADESTTPKSTNKKEFGA